MSIFKPKINSSELVHIKKKTFSRLTYDFIDLSFNIDMNM